MKKIILISVLFLCILLFGYCKKQKIAINFIEDIILSSEKVEKFNETNLEDLRGRIILINTYKLVDLTNIFSLNLAAQLKNIYKNKIMIIDIITDDKDFSREDVQNFIVKNNIDRPVFLIKNYTTEKHFVLVNKKGIAEQTFNKGDLKEIQTYIDNLIEKKDNKFVRLQLEKQNIPEPFIKSLRYIKYWNNSFILVDSKNKLVYILNKNGNIVKQMAGFCYPAGISIKDKMLYVADSCDNSIKKVNLETMDIEKIVYVEQPLAIAFIEDTMFISTATQLLKLEDNELKTICGNCANTFKLTKYDNKIYFINDGYIKFIDKDLFINDVRKVDNNNGDFLHVDETGIFIADRFNNKILRLKNDKLETYSEGKIYNFPTDIIDYKDKLFITNENNREILMLDKTNKKVEKINITFDEKYNYSKKEEFLHLENLETIQLKSNTETKIIINLDKDYTLENFAPQFLQIFEEFKEQGEALIIKEYNKNEIVKNRELQLPIFENNKIYYIKGEFIYNKKDKPFLIKRYNVKITTNDEYNNNNVVIDFLY
ncbi:MAG: hypothetical protein LBT02_00695 [Rickettsiales bacterium]|jgi:hypothetical protein|nr:hypothetical protein [Rickettsiales bacterium]